MSDKKIVVMAFLIFMTAVFANTQTANTDYDNTVTEIIKPFDTKEIMRTLNIEVGLKTDQQKEVKEILVDYEKEYKKLAEEYDKKAKILAANREMLVNIRQEINKKLSFSPCVIKPHLYGLQIFKYEKMLKDKYPNSKNTDCFKLEKRQIPAEHPQKLKVPLENQPAP